jgi:hypothetical protein
MMETIIIASTPGIFTEELLKIFDDSIETECINLCSFQEMSTTQNLNRSSAKRIVFYGEFEADIIQNILNNYSSTKAIFIFDTAETAVLPLILVSDHQISVTNSIDHWIETIGQMTLLTETNMGSSVLVDYQALVKFTAPTLDQIQKKLNIQLKSYTFVSRFHSSIAHLISSVALINRDETMVFYDDARTLAIATPINNQYVEATSLISNQQAAAIEEFRDLLGVLQSEHVIENPVSTASQLRVKLENLQQENLFLRSQVTGYTTAKAQLEAKESDLVLSQLQIRQLRDDIELSQLAISQLREELEVSQKDSNNAKKELLKMQTIELQRDSAQSQLDITLLQIRQLQGELEEYLEKYNFLEQAVGATLMEKSLGDISFLGLIRSQSNRSPSTN